MHAAFAAVAVTCLVGCSAAAARPGGPGTAAAPQVPEDFQLVAGVEVSARMGAWTGAPDMLDVITPVQVRVDNGSGRYLRLRLADFAVVSLAGSHAAVLQPNVGPAPAALYAPRFVAYGLLTAPTDAAVYPNVREWAGWFPRDAQQELTAARAWPDARMPTPEMRSLALPDGVLQPGGSSEGFVYVVRPAAQEPGARLRFDLVDAESGKVFGTATVPLGVQ